MTICNSNELLSKLQNQVNCVSGKSAIPWKQTGGGCIFGTAIKCDGTLWTWGGNGRGQLGRGPTTLYTYSPGTVAGGGKNWCLVSAAEAWYVSAIKCDGTIWTWGSNNFGELGDGTTERRSSPGTIWGGGTTWCSVATGIGHVMALKTDGTLWTWGRNNDGQLGTGTTVDRCSPGTVAGSGTTWCFLPSNSADQGLLSAAIKTDGTMWTWGYNRFGVLGNGSTVSRCSPGTVAGGGTTWCQISVEFDHMAAIKTDGTLWTWGNNSLNANSGVLGDGTTVDRCSPGTVAGGGTTWCQVSAGNYHDAAIKTDGTLWTWGDLASAGESLGDGTVNTRSSPGTIWNGGTTWCQVLSEGGVRAIKCDGTMWTWGLNTFGVTLGNKEGTNRCSPGLFVHEKYATPQEILLLSASVVNTTPNRKVSVASSDKLPNASEISDGQIIFIENLLTPVVSNNSCWLTFDGSIFKSDFPPRTMFTWGRNNKGALGNGTTVNRCSPGTIAGGGTIWKELSLRNYSTLAIKTDGTLWTWGNNGYGGKLGDGTTVDRCSPGTVAGGGTTWCQASAGYYRNAAIKTDGTLWTWGSNFCGQLGDVSTVSRCSPGTVAGGGTTWCQVSSGKNHIVSIKTDGTLWTWGYNNYGQLGDGTTVSKSSPVTIAGGGTNWCHIATGFHSVLAIQCDGTLWTWGYNCFGVLGNGTTVSRCSPGTVAGGGTTWCQASTGWLHSSAIKTDGTLWTWGYGSDGQLGNGTTVSRCSPGTVAGGGTTWCQVSIALSRSAAIKTDGTLWTWGWNGQGTLGDGTTISRFSPGTVFGGGNNWVKVSMGTFYQMGAIKSY